MHASHVAGRAWHEDECFRCAWTKHELRSHFNRTRNITGVRVLCFDVIKVMTNIMAIGEDLVVVNNAVSIFEWSYATKRHDRISK